ncbi:MAG: polysaccharide deacetylase family protein [Rhodospirillales bacterium]
MAEAPAPAAWAALEAELDCWRAAGRAATLWWRDDDAARPGPLLDRLINAADACGAPLVLAVTPERAEPALWPRLADAAGGVWCAVHGFAHANHAPKGEKKQELGAHRPAGAVLKELNLALETLLAAAPRPLPVLVPPWNRISPAVADGLAGLGYRGLSAYKARTRGPQADEDGLAVNNTHVDVVDWRAAARFIGEARALGRLTLHLRNRRTGLADANEATGLLTHHAAHGAAAWEFIEALTHTLSAHSAVRWAAPENVFQMQETQP